MPVAVIGIDHVFLAVSDLRRSERYYDRVMAALGFRKTTSEMNGEPHVHYYNRHYGFTIRPARSGTPPHDSLAPGLHHFCFRVDAPADVDRAAEELRQAGVEVTGPKTYAEYAADYYAIFFADPDGIRLEVTNFREERRRHLREGVTPSQGGDTPPVSGR